MNKSYSGTGKNNIDPSKVVASQASYPKDMLYPPQRYTQVEKDRIVKAEKRKEDKERLGEPYMKVTYMSGNYVEEVEFSPKKPLQGTSYFISPSDWNARAFFFVTGILFGGIVVTIMAGGLR